MAVLLPPVARAWQPVFSSATRPASPVDTMLAMARAGEDHIPFWLRSARHSSVCRSWRSNHNAPFWARCLETERLLNGDFLPLCVNWRVVAIPARASESDCGELLAIMAEMDSERLHGDRSTLCERVEPPCQRRLSAGAAKVYADSLNPTCREFIPSQPCSLLGNDSAGPEPGGILSSGDNRSLPLLLGPSNTAAYPNGMFPIRIGQAIAHPLTAFSVRFGFDF